MSKSIAIIFPGQGSQSVGMLSELAAAWPLVGETFAEASDTLGMDLWQVVSQGPRELLDRTDITQPAMLAAGVAVWRVWNQAGGPAPAWMAGHSLGEFTALVCAGSLGFADAIALVAQHGRFMQEAVPAGAGAMAAVLGLADDQVVAVCAQAAQGGILEPVNFNSPGQVVIAGEAAAVERGIAAAKAAGAKRAILLPVSVPSHCALMRPAAERLAPELAALAVKPFAFPVIANVDAEPNVDPSRVVDLLIRQIDGPVQWVKTIERMAAEGVMHALEIGPGKVLAGLVKRIARQIKVLNVSDPEAISKVPAFLES